MIPVGCGIFIYYTLLYVKQNAGVLTNEISADMMQRFSQIVKSLFGNKLMLVLIAAGLSYLSSNQESWNLSERFWSL